MGNSARGAAVNSESNLTDYEKSILENVDEWGCHITTVVDPDGSDPPFSYSAGLEETFGSGEVIIIGFSTTLMGQIINMLADKLEAGLALTDGVSLGGLLSGFDMIAKEIPAERIVRENFNSSMWLHERVTGGALTKAFQLVWPDSRTGLFSWDASCPEDGIKLQPLIFEQVS